MNVFLLTIAEEAFARRTSMDYPASFSHKHHPKEHAIFGYCLRRFKFSSTGRQKSASRLSDERATLIRPLKGFGQGAVEVLDEGQDLGLQIFNRDKAAAFEQAPHQNAEPNLNLVELGLVCVSLPSQGEESRPGRQASAWRGTSPGRCRLPG